MLESFQVSIFFFAHTKSYIMNPHQNLLNTQDPIFCLGDFSSSKADGFFLQQEENIEKGESFFRLGTMDKVSGAYRF